MARGLVMNAAVMNVTITFSVTVRMGRDLMKVSIKGDDVTPEKIAAALAACERDHGLKIKGATIYVRFEDHLGRTVEPLKDGHEITRVFTFRKPRPVQMPAAHKPQMPPEPVDPISAREMMDACQQQARRMLSSPEMKALIELEKTAKPGRKEFIQALHQSVSRAGYFSIQILESILRT